MKKKKKNGKAPSNGEADWVGELPWFIRVDEQIELVWKKDPAIKAGGFPLEKYGEIGVAPRQLVKFKPGEEPTIFHVRTMTREEQVLIYGVMAQSSMEGDAARQYVFLMDEAAKKCIEKCTLPDGRVFTRAHFEKYYKDFFGTIAAAVGNFVVNESVRDPLDSAN